MECIINNKLCGKSSENKRTKLNYSKEFEYKLWYTFSTRLVIKEINLSLN